MKILVILVHLKTTVPALKELNVYNSHNIGVQMKRKLKKPFGLHILTLCLLTATIVVFIRLMSRLYHFY